ncbi:MAG: PaaI family thioesterase [Solirubrobacterales bacterium]
MCGGGSGQGDDRGAPQLSEGAPHPSSLITPESVRGFLPGSFPGDLGIEPLTIEESQSRGRIVVDRRHLHPGGFVHGGVWTALGDTVAAWATFRVLAPGHNFTTIELKLNVFAAGVEGDEIHAYGEPLHTGKSTVVIEVRMERRRQGAEPRLAANLIVTQFVLPAGA